MSKRGEQESRLCFKLTTQKQMRYFVEKTLTKIDTLLRINVKCSSQRKA